DVIDIRMPRQQRAGLAAIASNDVEHARRYTCLQRELCHTNSGQRRILRRLHHESVAHGERCSGYTSQNLHRVVPRNDPRNDAMRLAQREGGIAIKEWDRIAMDLVARAAVEFVVANGSSNVCLALPDR